MIALLLAALLCQEDKGIDELVRKKIGPTDPGVAVLALRQGKIVHRKGYGLADLDAQLFITPGTLFDLASCSKQFTAVAVLRLAEQELLELDDDVRKWLPELKVHDPKRPIRVSDLLHHTSGLQDYLGLWDATRTGGRLDNAGALGIVAQRSLAFPTGTQWGYSNTNYCLLALIVERISKKSFGSFMKEEIFRNAGMKTADVLEPGSRPKNRAAGYEHRGGAYKGQSGGPLTTGDGGIFLSLDDWIAFEKSRPGLLKKELWAAAFAPGKLDDGTAHDYGFGVGVRKVGGKTMIGHEGEWAGFRSYFVRWIEDDITLVILANRTNLELDTLADAIGPRLFK
ncbi:MAG TPA: serine hydrolase domain-containing protein [Candidatus Eisenbacteria bacterium]|nr:serine hydrolase domain-containing protein [Candidatus Eisenbacteria bacterium]